MRPSLDPLAGLDEDGLALLAGAALRALPAGSAALIDLVDAGLDRLGGQPLGGSVDDDRHRAARVRQEPGRRRMSGPSATSRRPAPSGAVGRVGSAPHADRSPRVDDASLHESVRRLGRCEARVIGRADGDPTAAQRKIVIARDVTCIGCGAPSARCQIHHIRYRSKQGRTIVENLVLVCWSCHQGLHHLGWTVTRAADGSFAISKRRAG